MQAAVRTWIGSTQAENARQKSRSVGKLRDVTVMTVLRVLPQNLANVAIRKHAPYHAMKFASPSRDTSIPSARRYGR